MTAPGSQLWPPIPSAGPLQLKKRSSTMKTTAFVLILIVICAVGLAGPLKIVTVSFPAINCKFDTDCKITVNDKGTNFTLPGATGTAFLQSRLWPKGQAGTAGANLYAYLYRLDVRQPAGATNIPCVTE